MAYSIPWDEASPDGAITPAADLDVEIQDVKTSLRERLEQVIPDFGDDLVDPKVIPLTAIQGLDLYCAAYSPGLVGLTATPAFLPLTLQSENGGYTVLGTEITLPEDGVYSVDFSFNLSLAPGCFISVTVIPTGTAIAANITQILGSTDPTATSQVLSLSANGVVYDVAAGDTLQFRATDVGVTPGTSSVLGGTITVKKIAG